MTRKVISLRLEPETIERLDAAARKAGQTRTQFIEDMIAFRGVLSGERPDQFQSTRNTKPSESARNTEPGAPCITHPNAEMKSWGRWCPDCSKRV